MCFIAHNQTSFFLVEPCQQNAAYFIAPLCPIYLPLYFYLVKVSHKEALFEAHEECHGQ